MFPFRAALRRRNYVLAQAGTALPPGRLRPRRALSLEKAHARHQLRRAYLAARRMLSSALIDRRRGIETAREVDLHELGLAHPERVQYEPTSWLGLRRALRACDAAPQDVFLDYGSGKGRVLLAAARAPFKRVVGVDISSELCAIARSNLERDRPRRRCGSVEVVPADVAMWEVPDDITVAFMYNPFRGATFDAAVGRLLASLDRRPRPLRLVYHVPMEEHRLLATGRARRVLTMRGLRPGPRWSRKLATHVYELLPADRAAQESVSPAAARSLCSGFLRTSEEHPDRPALEVDGVTRSYAELRTRAASIAATLQRHAPEDEPPLTALLAARTTTAFEGVLGVLMRGHGYVPLGVKFPADRNREMLERAGCSALVVDASRVASLEELLGGIERRLVVLMPELPDGSELAAQLPQHTILAAHDLEPAEAWRPAPFDPDAVAYLLFTSGSTGIPKGVMVAHRNAVAFIDVMSERYGIGVDDRLSQAFELTFDVSVFDMFMAWENGACLCCPPEAALMSPARFIRDNALTVWYSVPTIGAIMRRLGALNPNALPSLRWSLFAGEPLTVELARAWATAAPNSQVENLYGPTELTVTCALYRWEGEPSVAEAENGVVPIGIANPTMRAIVVDEALKPVAPGDEGELLMAGAQVTLGYWRDPERTAAAFVVPPGEDAVYYRTGDRVRRPKGDAPMTYLGRIDHQIKVHGYRVELGEIEAALREATDIDAVIAMGWPRTDSGASGIVAFAGDADLDVTVTLEKLRARLPAYMVPRTVHRLASLPLNTSGKYDRRALLELLENAKYGRLERMGNAS